MKVNVDISLPKFPSVHDIALKVSTPPARRMYRKSNSLVSFMERMFNVNQEEEDPLPSEEEVAQIENERDASFVTLANRTETQYNDGIAAGALIGTGLTVASALGGAPIAAAVLLASVAEFTAFAGSPGPLPKSRPSLYELELKETTVIA